jgi:hypothetical protein
LKLALSQGNRKPVCNPSSSEGAVPKQLQGDLRRILGASMLIGGLYLFNVQTPFDFIDDGAIPHSLPEKGLAGWLQDAWNYVLADYHGRGTFLPTTWTFWRLEATLFGPDPMPWRLTWALWCMISAFMMMALMCELRIAVGASIAATAFAIWNGHRIEIWTNLVSPEALAMPFATFALFAAARAGKSRHPLFLDLAGMLAVMVALGCKNTFAAVIPAQVFLRVVGDRESLIDGLRRNWKAGLLVSLTVLWPLVHILHFRANWRPGQYVVEGPSLTGLTRLLAGWRRGVLTPFVAPPLLLAMIAVWVNTGPGVLLTALYCRYRRALIAGALLAAAGLLVYLPMGWAAGGPGRYTIPAIFGFDLLLAVAFSELIRLPVSKSRRTAIFVLYGALAVAAVYNLALQDRFRARAVVLTDFLNEVETRASAGSIIGWPGSYSDSPTLGEGIHFRWHLQQRGRHDIHFRFLTEGQNSQTTAADAERPSIVVGSTAPELAGHAGSWSPRTLTAPYWFGLRAFHVQFWQRS